MINNLAIKGGGVKGVAFVGALQELQARGLLSELKRVAGTSAGAMLAAMISVGYSVVQIEGLMRSIDFSRFKRGFNPLRMFTHYGVYSGDYILEFVHRMLADSPLQLQRNASFADLQRAGGRELYVFAAELNSFSLTEFSFYNNPEVPVASAVRASMSIPIYFKAWHIKEGGLENRLYVDGGILLNYPLSIFNDQRFSTNDAHPWETSLGLYLESKQLPCPRPLGRYQLFHYTRHLCETMLNSQDVDFKADPLQRSRTVMIDDLGVLATDFHLGKKTIDALIASGRQGVVAHLSQHSLQPLSVPFS